MAERYIEDDENPPDEDIYSEVDDYEPNGAREYSSEHRHFYLSSQPDESMYKTLLARSHFRPVFQTEQSYGSHLPQSQPAIRHDDDSLQYNASQSEYTSVSENEKSVYENDNPGNNGRAETCEEESLPENAYYNLVQARREERNTYHYMCSNQYKITVSNEIMEKIRRFNSGPDDFLKVFETTHDEIRTDEEAFIINDLLRKSDSPNSQIMDGKLDHLAMLACCNSPHVVKRALDALLNEIFLSISDYSRIRCFNILKAENIFRASFLKFVKVDHFKAKSHRMTTYAWLITLVLLKCSKEECIEIQPKIKEFDKTLDALQSDKEHSSRNTFRFGIYLARESIKRIIQHCGKKIFRESLNSNLKKCENVLNSKLEKNEVMKLGRAINDGGNWLDLHVCLVFLQDLPKFHQFQDNPKPIILIQMLIADFRERCSGNKFKSLLKISSYKWQFEILVYHLMLRLIRTSKDKSIIEQVLTGEQGCGGLLRSWILNKSKATKNDKQVLMLLEKLCERAVFLAAPNSFKTFITDNCKGDEKRFIENLSILRVASTYRDKVLEILPETRVHVGRRRVSAYGALMSGKKCLLKLHQHSKEEVLRADALKTVPLRKEIEILKVLSAEPCQNLVRLLGSRTKAPMHMIIERTPKGDLLAYLEGLAALTTPPEAELLIQIALDVCNAMIYLGARDIIHRDLCSKNCFIFMQDGKLLTKLGDFRLAVLSYTGPNLPTGLSRKPTSFSEHFPNQFAVRWMAIEALQFREFSIASDVWSFGVLLFEIFTFGCKPYVNMPSGLSLESDEEVEEFVTNGNRLELHPKIPKSIQVQIELTMIDADHRPTFLGLKDNLMPIKFNNSTYEDPANFDISYNKTSDTKPIDPRTGCNVQGCFGECLKASDIATLLNDDDNSRHFTKEFIPASLSDIQKLAEFKSPLLAVITNRIVHIEKVELITEVGDMGNLEEFIEMLGCTLENGLRYLSQIGEAVSFLQIRRFIHRNLRASSVFIYSDGNAKLACLARVRRLKPNSDDHSSTIPIKLPMPQDSLRWSSPEIIIDGEYSNASDVWGFGVLIWEMFTLLDKELNESDEEVSSLPYHQLSSKEEILSYLTQRKRLGQPKSCPDWLYEMMLECWAYNTEDRLKCEDIEHRIKEQVQSTTTDEDQHE